MNRIAFFVRRQNGKVFYDKLTYIYLEMPNFKKLETELGSRFDQWLFFIQHLEDFQAIPAIFKDEVFERAFAKAALAGMGQAELDRYEHSLKTYRDLKNVLDTAFDEGKVEGKIEVAKALKAEGLPHDVIAKATGLSLIEIAGL